MKRHFNITFNRAKAFGSLVFLSLLLFGKSYAQPLDTIKLDQLFDQLQAKNQAMGSIVLSKNGQVLYQRSIGYASIADKVVNSADTRYRIGSITKMFTATMIFQLIEEDKLKLYTTLDKYFPDLPYAEMITISNLLNHRSGLHNFTEMDYGSWNQKPQTIEEMLDKIVRGGIDFQPDQKAGYSNSNYLLLGYIIEMITQQSYAENLEKRITSRINLMSTYVGGKTDLNRNECYSYYFNKTWIKASEADMSNPGGAGCIVSTPNDLCKFSETLFSLKLVSSKSLAQMQTFVNIGGMPIGRGMMKVSFDNYVGYGHGGVIDGFRCGLYYFSYDGLSISYCSNGMKYPIMDILTDVLNIVQRKSYQIPAFEIVTVKPEILNGYTGIYSSKENPLKMTITSDGRLLAAKREDQENALGLEAVSETKFRSDLVNVELHFRSKNEMILSQNDEVFLYTKEE